MLQNFSHYCQQGRVGSKGVQDPDFRTRVQQEFPHFKQTRDGRSHFSNIDSAPVEYF